MSNLLRIGACELDLAAREVRVAGQTRPVEPRVAALLAYLAARPDRVVTKQELLEAVWAGRPVSDAALARAVMKARQAIGDTGKPPLIRNLPRIGYRLAVARIEPALGAPGAPMRLAILPFDNATGDAALDWVRLGLMALVAQSLGQDPRLAVAATPTILTAVEGAQFAGVDVVAAARSATGAQVIVLGRVERAHDGYELMLECTGIGKLQVRADDAGKLGPRAVREMLGLLFPGAANAPPFEVGDPLATTAFARGLQALAQQKFPQAANLLRMTLALAPGSQPVELALLRTLCGFGDLDGGQPIADRLLADAEHSGDSLLAARVNLALGLAHMFHSLLVPAAFHVDQGLRLLGEEGPLDEQARGYLMRAQIAELALDHEAAEQALERMRITCHRSGDRVLPVAGLDLLGFIASAKGQEDKSTDLYLQAALAAREVHAHCYMISADSNAADGLVRLGRWSEAVSHAEQAFAAAVLMNDKGNLCLAAVAGTYVYMIVGVPAAAQRIVQSLPAAENLSPLGQLWALLARSNHAIAAGDHEQAVQLLRQALQLMRDGGNRANEEETLLWLLYSLVRCGRLDEAQAELAAVLPSTVLSDLDPTLQRLLHCQAHLVHARGQAAQALEILLDLADADIVPLWRAWAALDAAWLYAESGRSAEARALLKRLRPEFAAQPLTSAVAARVQFAEGDHAGALRLHRQYVAGAADGIGQPFLVGLGACYSGRGLPAPLAPGLPSRL
ncbi:MAG: winged helix-turn-helix domain-containing protein [Burkholderiaceae bacterium]